MDVQWGGDADAFQSWRFVSGQTFQGDDAGLGAGLVWHAPLGMSPANFGLGASVLGLSELARRETGNNREAAWELFFPTRLLTLSS